MHYEKVYCSLETRWAKIDQDVFLMAVVLNPYLRHDRFNRSNRFLTEASLWVTFRRVYLRMLGEELNSELSNNFTEYIHHLGEWSNESMMLGDISARAAKDVSSVTVSKGYREINLQCYHSTKRLISLTCGADTPPQDLPMAATGSCNLPCESSALFRIQQPQSVSLAKWVLFTVSYALVCTRRK